MSQGRQGTKVVAQHKIAQKYRLLGYKVEENPEISHLPEFMEDVRPDIVARSEFDNVVVEVKEKSALKGSNELVGIAQQVSSHPDWRFELVVLPSKEDSGGAAAITTNFNTLLKKAEFAADNKLEDFAYIYLVAILVGQGHALAAKHKVRENGKADRDLFLDLSFRGVLPDEITQSCLSAISKRNDLTHRFDKALEPSKQELTKLLQLCQELEELT